MGWIRDLFKLLGSSLATVPQRTAPSGLSLAGSSCGNWTGTEIDVVDRISSEGEVYKGMRMEMPAAYDRTKAKFAQDIDRLNCMLRSIFSILGVTAMTHLSCMVLEDAYGAEVVAMDCSDAPGIEALPSALIDAPISIIDCVRETVSRSEVHQIEALNERFSKTSSLILSVKTPKLELINSLLVDINSDYRRVISFWKKKDGSISTSIRATYKNVIRAENESLPQFRPEFFNSNQEAVAFLTFRYGSDDQGIINALEGAGKSSRRKYRDGKNIIVIYDFEAPDLISAVLSLGDKQRFILKYRDNEFYGVFRKP